MNQTATIQQDPTSVSPISANGHIPLNGPSNTRDLAGIRTNDGSRIQPKRLIRSGALYRSTEEDIRTLRDDYRVSKIIDLRTEKERISKPDPVNAFKGADFINIGLINTEALGISRDEETMMKAVRELAHNPAEAMIDIYPKMVLEEESQKGITRFFDELLESSDGAILWHCSAGKDRVGITTALLLTVLDVPHEVIVQDYLATNRYLEGSTQEILSAFAALNLPDQVRQGIQVLNSADIRFLDSALSAIDAEYGTLQTYLSEAIGLDEEKTHALRSLYLVA